MNPSIKMEVGIEDCLHIEFEYNKSKFVVTGLLPIPMLSRHRILVRELLMGVWVVCTQVPPARCRDREDLLPPRQDSYQAHGARDFKKGVCRHRQGKSLHSGRWHQRLPLSF